MHFEPGKREKVVIGVEGGLAGRREGVEGLPGCAHLGSGGRKGMLQVHRGWRAQSILGLEEGTGIIGCMKEE